jgi:hypothetical protein
MPHYWIKRTSHSADETGVQPIDEQLVVKGASCQASTLLVVKSVLWSIVPPNVGETHFNPSPTQPFEIAYKNQVDAAGYKKQVEIESPVPPSSDALQPPPSSPRGPCSPDTRAKSWQ